MLQYKIIKHNDHALHEMGEDNWILSCISEGKMYFYKEVKKQRKSTAIVSTEILSFQGSMRRVCGVSRFKETTEKELSMIKNCYDLANTIGMDQFMYRLKTILEDDFKSKHSNKLTYLYRELSAFITPVIKVKEKESALDIIL